MRAKVLAACRLESRWTTRSIRALGKSELHREAGLAQQLGITVQPPVAREMEAVSFSRAGAC